MATTAGGAAGQTPPSAAEAIAANQRLWDIWTKIHAEGDFYVLAAFREGGARLRPYELKATKPVG